MNELKWHKWVKVRTFINIYFAIKLISKEYIYYCLVLEIIDYKIKFTKKASGKLRTAYRKVSMPFVACFLQAELNCKY